MLACVDGILTQSLVENRVPMLLSKLTARLHFQVSPLAVASFWNLANYSLGANCFRSSL